MADAPSSLSGIGIVYFGNEWFAENRTSSHHIARRLAAHCTVLYVDSPGLRAPRASGRDLRRLFRKLAQTLRRPTQVASQLWHCTVPQIPLRKIPGISLLNRSFGRWAVRRAINSIGMKRRISWFVVPHPGFLAGKLGEELTVYYCIDDYAAHPGVDAVAVSAADEALSRTADQVFVAPPALLEAKRGLNPHTQFAPHGVDFDLFASAGDAATEIPAKARGLARPVIGFFGLLGDWVDIDLLAQLARARPQWTFLIVGHVATDLAPLAGLGNFIFVGAQPYESLPGWARAFDVAVMPYRMNRQVQNANPLKLREYLATGKPVVSVPTPEVERFAPHVRMAATAEGFLAAIEQCLQNDDVNQRAARMDCVRGMSWDSRVAEVVATVGSRLGQGKKGSLMNQSAVVRDAPAAPRPLRIGIVGAGYVSRHHISALRTLSCVQVVGIADLDRDAALAIANQFSIPLACSSLAELVQQKPDAIYVLTPPGSHAALTLQALDMGCHVFVEKPMAETAADCEAMIARAREKGLILSVNHSDRLDPVVLAALEKVRAGACGDLVAVDFIRGSEYIPYAGGTRAGPYRKGSYPFQDLGVHGLYLLEAFLGPILDLQVHYRSIAKDPYLLFDDWHAVANCERGLGRLHLSWIARPMQSRLLVQGTRGSLDVDRFLQTLTLNRVRPGPKFIGMVLNAVFGSLRRAFAVCGSVLRFATGRLRPSPGIYAGAVDFARAVAEGRSPTVTAEEGLRIVRLMEAISRRADAEAQGVFADRLRPLEPADALVTGATGFLGSAVLRRLVNEGRSVRVLVRRRPKWADDMPHVQVVIGDLGDPEIVTHAVKGAAVVYHVGATMRGSPEQFRSGTTVGTRNVIEACLRQGTSRLVYVSSLSVMDHAGRKAGTVLHENLPYEPYPQRRGAYTQTKLDAERAVLEAIDKRGLPAVVLRPGQIFGPGAEHIPPNGVIALAGRWLLVGSGRLPLPLVFIDDVVDGLMAAGRHPGAAGRIFNLVDTSPISQNEYLDACRKLPGRPLKIVRVPRWLMYVLASGVELLGRILKRDVPLSRYRVASLRPLANFDCSAARDGLGWTPAVGARAGIKRTFAAD